jgi:hypothetical protein
VMAWNATADLFYLRGMWHVAQVIRDLVSSVARTSIPRTREPGAGLAFISLLFSTKLRFDADLQGWKQKRLIYSPTLQKDEIDGNENACLNKWGIGHYSPSSSISGNEDLLSDDSVRRSLLRSIRASADWTRSSGDEPRGVPDQPDVGARFCVCLLPSVLCSCKAEPSGSVRRMGAVRSQGSAGSTGHDVRISLTPHWENEYAPGPLDYLQGRSQGLDFSFSTKRGAFKSKRQWVSLAG